MSKLLIALAVLAAVLVLQKWVLSKFGIFT